MARLFSAVELPGDVLDDLAEHLARVRADTADLRWEPRERWHITLGFYGDGQDVGERSAWLRDRVATHPPSRTRLLGAGQFPGVLWVGVDEEDGALRALGGALAGGQDQREFVPHLTVARWRKREPSGGVAGTRAAAALDGYVGRWWQTDEVVLFRSELTRDGPVYTAVDRVALSGAPGTRC
jgi:RNA 2',3'-cyclic 3'-phosphodiesterase